MDILSLTLFDNSLLQWSIALSICAGAIIVLRVLQAVVVSRLRDVAAKLRLIWPEKILDGLSQTKLPLLILIGVWAGSLALELPDRAETILGNVVTVAVMIQIGLWALLFLNAWLTHFREKNIASNPGAVTSIGALGFIGKLVIWSAVVLMALSNLGVDITALVAGLGIGGIAVALAVQNILGDLFASMTIVVDKPFVIGDFLILGEHMGVVEHIGLKSTRIRSLSGEQIILSNTELLNSRIRNYGRMYERRVLVELGVTYQTSRDNLKKIPDIIRSAVEKQQKTRFDRAHFKSYGNFSLNFEYVYYVLAADFNLYMDIQQAINLDIHEAFEKAGIEFAYPTQTLFVQGLSGQASNGQIAA